jgi:restriction system protein
LSKQFNLTDEERRQLLPSGKQPIIDNRIGWARTYIIKAGLIESTRRSYFRITERGLSILQQNLPEITVKTLRQFQEFNEFHDRKSEDTATTGSIPEEPVISPEEALEKAYLDVRDNLEAIPKPENGTKLKKILVVQNARNSHFQRENANWTSRNLDYLPLTRPRYLVLG